MDRVKDASERGIKAATVPGVRALLRAHIPKHWCTETVVSLGCGKLTWCAYLNRGAGLSCAIFPILRSGWARCQRRGPIAGSLVKTCCKRSDPTEISPVNVSVDLVPQPFTNSLVAHSDYFDRP